MSFPASAGLFHLSQISLGLFLSAAEAPFPSLSFFTFALSLLLFLYSLECAYSYLPTCQCYFILGPILPCLCTCAEVILFLFRIAKPCYLFFFLPLSLRLSYFNAYHSLSLSLLDNPLWSLFVCRSEDFFPLQIRSRASKTNTRLVHLFSHTRALSFTSLANTNTHPPSLTLFIGHMHSESHTITLLLHHPSKHTPYNSLSLSLAHTHPAPTNAGTHLMLRYLYSPFGSFRRLQIKKKLKRRDLFVACECLHQN